MQKNNYCKGKKPCIQNVQRIVEQSVRESDHIKWFAARVTVLNMLMLGDL